MAIPTVTELNEAKEDLDDLEAIVNGFSTVATRTGGNKQSLSQLLAQSTHGVITTYSSTATYTDIDDWVSYTNTGVSPNVTTVYRPIPSALPIAPTSPLTASPDTSKWVAAAGFKIGDRLHPSVDNYAALRNLLASGYLTEGTIIYVTDDGIAGPFKVLRDISSPIAAVADNDGTIITEDGGTTTANDLYAQRVGNAIDIEHFGAVAGADSSAAIRAAITYAAGRPVYIPAKSYIYDEAIIATDKVCLVGERMPNLNDLSVPTALVNGSIIIGKMELSGKNISITNLGIDRGSDNFGTAEDALALIAPGYDTGESAHLQNVVGLGQSSAGQFHGVQVEGYRHVTMDNVIGANLWFPIVMKCTTAVANNLIAVNGGKDGLIIKADSTDGLAADINVTGFSCHMDTTQPDTNALRIRAQDAGISAKRITVTGMTGRFATNGINIDASNPGQSIDDVVISSVVLDDCTNGIQCKGKVNNLMLAQVSAVNVSGFLANFDTNGVDSPVNLQIDGLYGSLDGASLFIDDAVHFGSAVGSTMLNNIEIVVDRSLTTFGAIQYLNNQANNTIGSYRCNLRGAGIPNHGWSSPSVTGTAQALPLTHNRRENKSFLSVTFAAGATVSTMDSTIWTSGFGSTEYPEGYTVVIHNTSTETGVINHNAASSGFFNKGAANVTLLQNECVTYTYSGFLWLES